MRQNFQGIGIGYTTRDFFSSTACELYDLRVAPYCFYQKVDCTLRFTQRAVLCLAVPDVGNLHSFFFKTMCEGYWMLPFPQEYEENMALFSSEKASNGWVGTGPILNICVAKQTSPSRRWDELRISRRTHCFKRNNCLRPWARNVCGFTKWYEVSVNVWAALSCIITNKLVKSFLCTYHLYRQFFLDEG